MLRFASKNDGNLTIATALLLPVILMLAGAGLDFTKWAKEGADMQELSDTLALLGAREFLLANTTGFQVESVIKTAMNGGAGEKLGLSTSDMSIDIDEENASVTVSFVKTPAPSIILSKITKFKKEFHISSTAVAHGGMNVCVVALEGNNDGAISASVSSKLEAADCTIMSNSTTPNGVEVLGSSKITAGLVCSAGGYKGTLANYDPMPTMDCPIYPDPLSSREAPNVASPVFEDTMLGEHSEEVFIAALTDSAHEVTLSYSESDSLEGALDSAATTSGTDLYHTQYVLDPGVYLGGIAIASNADVTLNPGVYIIKDGPLVVDMGARISGKGVAFYFTGDNATFTFGKDSKIDLEAPIDGSMAGILAFEDRNAPEGRVHRILSNDARNLLGTIYLSRGTLLVSTKHPIADESAYTVIVARQLHLSGDPTLVLNANYAATDVPVPMGVGPVSGNAYLRD